MNHLFDEIRARMPAPGKRFLETESGRSLTYGDVLTESSRIANAIVALGVKAGDRVAAQVDKSPEGLLLYLACVRAGAVFLPLNPAYTQHELAYLFSDAEPALIVCSPARKDEIAAIAGTTRVETLGRDRDGTLADRMRDAGTEFRDVPRGPDDLAAILYTSGTTGRSKGAMLSHENLASNARALVECWRFTGDDVLIHALPIFHTHGLFVATNVTLFAGASILFFSRFDPDQVLAAFARATTMMGVPTFYVRLLDHPGLDAGRCRGIRLFIAGSAPLLSETFESWRRKTGHSILERYGMTETSMNASNPYEDERIAGSVGHPLPGVELRISDSVTGNVLPAGEIGMIEVRGPNVFRGYWRMPEATADSFRDDGFFVTGDLGRFDGRGYLQIVGRSKDIIISGGFNVYPKEIEGEIDLVPGVAESAVVGLPHADFGEAVTAVVVTANGASLDEGVIFRALEPRLAKYKQPKRVVLAAGVRRNAMGGGRRNILRERYRGLYGDQAQSSGG